MQTPGTVLTLLIGATLGPCVPAPAFVMEALESVSVDHADGAPSGFQLELHADRARTFAPDYDLLLTRLLSTGARVVVVVTLADGLPRTLSDGFVTNLQMAHSRAAGGAVISVMGKDVGSFMDLRERTMQYPGLGDAGIVSVVLAEYIALLGLIPVVAPTPTAVVSDPMERTPGQRETDRRYIEQLASRHGYVFMIRPGPVPMTNTAYWGPPPRIGVPLSTLTVDMGSATNVESINFTYDGEAPERVSGVVQDAETEMDAPMQTMASLREPPLALEPALMTNGAFVRETLFDSAGMTLADAFARAQGRTDRSTDRVVTARGELDTFRYGSVLTTPGLVCVRGCGLSFDGGYYVNSVTHTVKRGEYKQSFGLAREGLMTTLPVAPPS